VDANFGNLADGRPIWVGDFTGDGRTDVLFYFPGDGNWILGSYDGNRLQWGLANDGRRPFPGMIILRGDIPDLDGWVEVTLCRNGTVRFRGHVHNDDVQSFEFRVTVIVRTDSTAIAMVYEGHVGGLQAGSDDPRDEDWVQTFDHEMVGFAFPQFENGRLEIQAETRGDITGWLEDVGTFLARFVVGGVLLNASGVLGAIVLGVGVGSLITTGGFTAGARIIGGTIWLLGSQGTLVALAAEGLAALGSQEREMSQDEYEWANQQVFRGTLPPRERIIITDTIGANDAPFTFPRFDGTITLNLGSQTYANPQVDDPATFIHELVHAWQLQNVYSDLSYLGIAIPLQVFNREGAYDINGVDGTQRFSSLNIEQQARVVETWFRRGAIEDFGLDNYYRYIVENIRIGTG
jgi:hypothetical protein